MGVALDQYLARSQSIQASSELDAAIADGAHWLREEISTVREVLSAGCDKGKALLEPVYEGIVRASRGQEWAPAATAAIHATRWGVDFLREEVDARVSDGEFLAGLVEEGFSTGTHKTLDEMAMQTGHEGRALASPERAVEASAHASVTSSPAADDGKAHTRLAEIALSLILMGAFRKTTSRAVGHGLREAEDRLEGLRDMLKLQSGKVALETSKSIEALEKRIAVLYRKEVLPHYKDPEKAAEQVLKWIDRPEFRIKPDSIDTARFADGFEAKLRTIQSDLIPKLQKALKSDMAVHVEKSVNDYLGRFRKAAEAIGLFKD